MKKMSYILFFIFLILSEGYAKGIPKLFSSVLSGKVTDKATGEALSGVSVYIPDLKSGTITNDSGIYILKNLPSRKVVVYLSYVGYKILIQTIDLNITSTMDFQMEESVAELHEVVVTGVSQGSERNKTPIPVTTIPKLQLLQVASSNIIETIARQPGVSQISTGTGISKPVIRGLGYNRIVVMNDGIRQEGQQWGDEHGIEVDEFSVGKVEILKGPASLSYGSDAIAGVINLLSDQTLPEGKIIGNVLLNYQTNNGLYGVSANIAGNKKGFIWDLRYSRKSAHAYKNKYDGYVYNSGFNENNLGGIIGLNKSWGYSHLHFSLYNITPGIVEGDRDSSTGKFTQLHYLPDGTFGENIVTENDLLSYNPGIPFQKVAHFKAVLNNSIILGNGSLKATIGLQQNARKEYADISKPNDYQLYFLLNTLNYDFRYILPEIDKFNISLGINGMHQISQNKGTEFLIPEYNLTDCGFFTIVKRNLGRLDIQGGLRYDTRYENTDALYLDENGNITQESNPNAYKKFDNLNVGFTSVSGSLGFSYQITNDIYSKVNLSRGFRALNISEISSNGVHEGTLRYEIGNPDLKPEHSLQLDFAVGLNTHHVTTELDLFVNTIDNFIYSQKLSSSIGMDSIREENIAYKFVAGNAQLLGGEIKIDIHPHPLDWLHFENSFSYVRAVLLGQSDSSKYLPYTPPGKYSSEIRANIKRLSKILGNSYFALSFDYYFGQDQIYSAYNTETITPAYGLLNIGLGTDILNNEKTVCSLYISINNLTDNAYQSHLSRLKYAPINNLTGRTGVYNMGRNISLKVIVPIDFSKK